MLSDIWAELRSRLRRPRVRMSIAAALLGTTAWIVLAATDRSSGGAGKWIPAVVAPGAAGALWLLAGALWLGSIAPPLRTPRCGACGYDLRRRRGADPRCPECGSSGTATTAPPAAVRWVGTLPGAAALSLGSLLLLLSLVWWRLIGAGVFDV